MAGTKRALVLAGGGLKVAFQAGVLEVWLDEAGVTFDHVDAASGGCFNAAMLCQGMTGRQMADHWRAFEPAAGIDLNIGDLHRLMLSSSMFTMDQYRRKVFPKWGLDWSKIRASPQSAAFNVFNFSRQQLETLPPAKMSEDALCACTALPMWFPPVLLGGDTYIDAVFVTDGNIEDAIARGADEVWVIWTVSQTGRWNDGFLANYFQIIEAAANGRFRLASDRIAANNEAIESGRPGEFGRPIALKVIRAEVPLHYLVNLSADRFAEVVNSGVAEARAWCQKAGIPLKSSAAPQPVPAQAANDPRLTFDEEMKGYVAKDEVDYDRGYRSGRASGTAASVELTIELDGVDKFITDPRHEGVVRGTVTCGFVGGVQPIEKGAFNLLVDLEDPTHKAMYYRLFIKDASGAPKTLLGFKDVKDDQSADGWTDTTTLFTRLLDGHVSQEQENSPTTKVLAAGILRLSLPDFMRQLTTFKVDAPTAAERLAALTRFGRLFLGKLWDVYAARVLPGALW
jgi:predicted acylesterase/phospholipase RssA